VRYAVGLGNDAMRCTIAKCVADRYPVRMKAIGADFWLTDDTAAQEKYPTVFGHSDPSDAFVLTNDFHSAGRIIGAKRIPISELKVGSFHRVENRRLQVIDSTIRYQK
jgi:hypothetical protein